MNKPGIPKGTRDFSTADMARRNYIFNTIRKHFQLFGFEQIETPAMELLSTLTGKYGEEGDQLLFKILNSRIHESKEKEKLRTEFELSLQQARNTEVLTERALRYDLTVPFARYVVMHQHELTFPFKRFQIQPVWRADKPQKGRYREFYQCDADVIGSDSLLNELELIRMMDGAFSDLQIPVLIKINNRKVLAGISEVIGEHEKIIDITVAIDKLDKIGQEKVIGELREKGISEASINKLLPVFQINGNNHERLNALSGYLNSSDIGLKGVEEIRFILDEIISNPLTHAEFEIDITLARGLNYYTGSIFEIKAQGGSLTSSICGGGRYDDLTGIFGLKNMSGVGISFGIDRIFDVMMDLNLFEGKLASGTAPLVLFMNFGTTESLHALGLANKLRKGGISSEVYPDAVKMKKQFEYADKKKIQFVCMVGSNEMQTGIYGLKNIISGEQENLNIDQIIKRLRDYV